MTQVEAHSSPNTPVTANQVLDSGAAPVEAPKTATPEVQDDKISPKLQALLKRESAATQREKLARDLESKATAREEALALREARLQEFESIKTTNPRKALELLGLSYQELTQAELNDGQVTPDIKIKQLEEKLDGFTRSQQEALGRQQEEAQRIEEQKLVRTVENFKGEITTYLKDNSARYELIEFEQNQDLVYQVIDEHYDRTLKAAQEKAQEEGLDLAEVRGEVMTIAQAADKVEQYLEQKYDKARSLNKVKTLLAPRPEQPVAKPKPNPSQTPKTLNNNLSATPQRTRATPVSDEERIAKAIAYARGLRP